MENNFLYASIKRFSSPPTGNHYELPSSSALLCIPHFRNRVPYPENHSASNPCISNRSLLFHYFTSIPVHLILHFNAMARTKNARKPIPAPGRPATRLSTQQPQQQRSKAGATHPKTFVLKKVAIPKPTTDSDKASSDAILSTSATHSGTQSGASESSYSRSKSSSATCPASESNSHSKSISSSEEAEIPNVSVPILSLDDSDADGDEGTQSKRERLMRKLRKKAQLDNKDDFITAPLERYDPKFINRRFMPMVKVNLDAFEKKFQFGLDSILRPYQTLLELNLPYSESVVKVFYTNISADRRTSQLTTKVRGVEIQVTEDSILHSLGIPASKHMKQPSYSDEDIFCTLMNSATPGKLDDITPSTLPAPVRVVHYLYTRTFVSKAGNYSHVTRDDLVHLTALMKRHPIHVGRLIVNGMMRVATARKRSCHLPYPSLVSLLLRRKGVWYLEENESVKWTDKFGQTQLNRMHIAADVHGRRMHIAVQDTPGTSHGRSKEKGKDNAAQGMDNTSKAQQTSQGMDNAAAGGSSTPSFFVNTLKEIVREVVAEVVKEHLQAVHNELRDIKRSVDQLISSASAPTHEASPQYAGSPLMTSDPAVASPQFVPQTQDDVMTEGCQEADITDRGEEKEMTEPSKVDPRPIDLDPPLDPVTPGSLILHPTLSQPPPTPIRPEVLRVTPLTVFSSSQPMSPFPTAHAPRGIFVPVNLPPSAAMYRPTRQRKKRRSSP